MLRTHRGIITLGFLLLIGALLAAGLIWRGRGVDRNTVGTWALSIGSGRWLWKIGPDGAYEFHSEAADGVAPHAGAFTAHAGSWSLHATNGYADNGTYRFQPPDTMIATGRLGTANWHRIVDQAIDPGAIGTWVVSMNNGRWVWKTDANGAYDFHSEAADGVASHAGKFSAAGGYWWLQATNGYADGGTYTLSPDAFIATGHLGTATWQRPAAWAKQTAQSAFDGDAKSLQRLTSASEQGDAIAQYWLGTYYHSSKDEARAVDWFKKSAAQGNADGEFDLAAAYELGRGIGQDQSEAAALYRKAADQDQVGAELALGNDYRDGKGVPQDDAQAVVWWEKAAAHNNSDADLSLSTAYRDGKGVPKDQDKFFYWSMKSIQDSLGNK
jgi:hypothetical protein